MNQFNKTFKTALAFIFITEILSFLGYYLPVVNKAVFFAILLITLILSLQKLEYGLYILLAELFIGSKGYLFYFDYGGIIVSLRIGLFIIIMGVWLFNLVRSRFTPEKNADLRRKNLLTFQLKNLPTSYWLLFAAIAWGIIYGVLGGNSFSNVFFDANAWLYFLLIFPLYEIIKTKEQTQDILQIFFAALIDIGVKSLFALWIFSHGVAGFSIDLYRWIRTSGVGEVTPVAGNFYRVFFQSQVYSLLGFFILFCLAIFLYKSNLQTIESKRQKIILFLLSAFCFLIIIVSFSRSFWVALAGGLVALFIYLIFVAKESWLRIAKLAGTIVLIAIIDLAFLYAFISFPRTGEGISLTSLIGERISASEAAGISRINQLKPLTKAIAKHPVIGSGFGTTVTYETRDPRVLAENPSGIYTTYAFEWGYLDIVLKIGLVGLVLYLFLVWQIFKQGIKNYELGSMNYLNLGLMLGLIALLIVNIFTPYLNHPLGIGYIMIAGIIASSLDPARNISD